MKIENEDYWSAFEKTGSVDAYLLYSRHHSDMQNMSRQEAAKDAETFVDALGELHFTDSDWVSGRVDLLGFS
ncbi:MAG: YqzL family protein, partial [Clostridia bacterium]|nr:YqzL family protein [Clostridia bacterium]